MPKKEQDMSQNPPHVFYSGLLSSLPTRLPTQPSGGRCQAEPSINNSEDLFRVGFRGGEWVGFWGGRHRIIRLPCKVMEGIQLQ